MLQQTRVETVRGYYERWMHRFPTLDALASAPIDQVLKAWEGLGYYARARNLHRGARLLRERHGGELPASAQALKALPGIGDYTAGAIASIAYGQPEPAVDGNVKRVLCRLMDVPRISSAQLKAEAARLVPASRPGDFNQALMELGATVCTPRTPRCAACPVSGFCLAFARGTQGSRPARKVKRALPNRSFVVLVLRNARNQVLMRQRPHSGLLGGLWEFPTREAKRPTALLHQLLGSSPPKTNRLGTVIHTFSHFRAHYTVYSARLETFPLPDSEHRILAWPELADLAMSVSQRSIYDRAASEVVGLSG
jgi:A/G-specific adenine glycosylase